MDLTLDEQKLLADFRRLTSVGKQELLEYAVFLGRKSSSISSERDPATNQCRLEPSHETRPESAKEPIFTE
jgi:hypothetical protein